MLSIYVCYFVPEIRMLLFILTKVDLNPEGLFLPSLIEIDWPRGFTVEDL